MIFPFKAGDILTFPDTETESIDVGIGVGVPVAQFDCYGYVKVVKRGRGLGLKMCDITQRHNEVFGRPKGKYVSLRTYLEHFGSFDDLTKLSPESEETYSDVMRF